MRKNLVMCLAVTALASAFGLSLTVADDKTKPAETPARAALPECPITDEPINFLVHTDMPDGRVYLCCGMCVDKYKKNAARFKSSVKVQRTLVARRPKVQVKCPMCDKAPAKDVTADYMDQKIGFCCKGCAANFGKDSTKSADKLADCFTYQTTCPVGGEDIDPASAITLKGGGKIYFCCDKCKPAFTKDFAKHASKLADQGYLVKATDLPEAGTTELTSKRAPIGDAAKISLAKAAISKNGPLTQAIDLFKFATGKYPASLTELMTKPGDPAIAAKWSGPYLNDADGLKDPWGREFKFDGGDNATGKVKLWSCGPDGIDGNDDDVRG